MSAQVKILVEGYTNANEVAETGEEKTQPTITLVRDGELVMVVDPGIMESHQILIGALAQENLTVDDVTVVAVTHSHLDHYRNVGMFPNAKVLEYFGVWHGNSVDSWSEQFSTHVQVLRTPGHDYTGITIFVTTDEGVVAICGDIFWSENYPEDPLDDKYASDKKELRRSRELVLKMADWIVPGHGPMYKTTKGLLKLPAKTNGKEKTNVLKCKKCHRIIGRKEKCLCRPWICYRCCECKLDCDICYCSHLKKRK